MATTAIGTVLFASKHILADGSIVDIRITRVPTPVLGAAHHLKYRCFYGRRGERLILYDNERGKGDHRHRGSTEEPYRFTSFADLMRDFLADVAALRRSGGREP